MFFKIVVLVLFYSIFNVAVNADVDMLIRDPSTPFFSKDKTTKVNQQKTNKVYKIYVLSSVFIGESKKMAVINGKYYSEGDQLGIYTVKKIEQNEVLIDSALHTKYLQVFSVNKTGFVIK